VFVLITEGKDRTLILQENREGSFGLGVEGKKGKINQVGLITPSSTAFL
jgi:hypothetical protein